MYQLRDWFDSLSFFWGGGQLSLRLVWSLLVYQLPSRRFKQRRAWQLKQSLQLQGHQITGFWRVGNFVDVCSWASHIKTKSFLRLIWHETAKTHNQPGGVCFFCRGRKVRCLEVPPFSALGGSDLRSFGSYAFSGLVTLFFRVGKPDFIKKRERPRGGLTILEFIIPKVSDHAFNGGVVSFFQEWEVVCRSKTERHSSHRAHMLNLV